MSQLPVMINQLFTTILEMISLFTGANHIGSIIIFWILAFIILTLILFIPLHRKIIKKLEIAKQELVKNIDEIIYFLTKSQYESKISKKELGGDPCMALMREMFKSGHFEYLDNIAIIKENVGKVELLLQKQVATPQQRNQVHRLQKKMKRLIFRKKTLGRINTVSTLGIYKLFW